MPTPLMHLVTLLPTLFLGIACFDRRRFWNHRGFAAANYGLASIAFGCLLISPATNLFANTTGTLVGIWRADLLIGLTLIMYGLQLFVLHLADTISLLDEQMARTASVTLTAFVALLWAGFFMGGLDHQPGTTDFPAMGRNFFWGVFSVWLVCVCAVSTYYAYNLLKLSHGPIHDVARWYCIAGGMGILLGAHRLFGLVNNFDDKLPELTLSIDYSLRAVAIAGLVIAARLSFRQVTKPLEIPDCWPPKGHATSGADDALAE